MNLRIELPPEVVEEIVKRVTDGVLAELRLDASTGRWLTGAAAAAAYLGCSPKRVYNRLCQIPHAKEDGRLVFHTCDLDEYRRGLA